MAKGDSPTRGRELNIHFGDVEDRNFIGQISHLGDMVPVMAGVTLSFKLRRQNRVGLVYVGDGATSTGAFHEGHQLRRGAALSAGGDRREQRLRLLDAHRPAVRGRASGRQGRRATAFPGCGPTATTWSRSTARPRKRWIAPAGARASPSIELMTYRRKGHAEHDNQSYVPDGRDRAVGPGERSARPLRRTCSPGGRTWTAKSWRRSTPGSPSEIDRATDEAETVSAAGAARLPATASMPIRP